MPTCPHCGHEADAPATECPLCGSPLSPEEAGPGGDGAGSPPAGGTGDGAPAATGPGPVPWEDPDLGFAAGIARTWTESMFEPSRFFSRIRDEGTVVRPLLYFLLVTLVASLATLVWDAMGLNLAQLAGYARLGERTASGAAVSFVLAPFFALFALVTLTVVYHLGALVAAPDRQGMGATARVVCYASAPSVLAVVPVVGTLVGGVWGLVLQAVGLREVHRTTIWRALFMIFWLWIALVGLGVLAGVMVGVLASGGDGALATAPGTAGLGPVPAGAADAVGAFLEGP